MCLRDLGAQLFGGDVVAVLRGDHDGVDAHRLAVHVLHADLALAVGAEEVELAGAADVAQAAAHSLCASMIGSGISSGVSLQA